jgi:hypothetical protein
VPEHGSHSGYVHGCRCAPCREAEKQWQRDYRVRNGERLRAYDRQPERSSKLRDDPAKRRARDKLKKAIKRGKMTRQPCEVCGAEPAQAHHDDYSKPLDVRWLCPVHHGVEHRA